MVIHFSTVLSYQTAQRTKGFLLVFKLSTLVQNVQDFSPKISVFHLCPTAHSNLQMLTAAIKAKNSCLYLGQLNQLFLLKPEQVCFTVFSLPPTSGVSPQKLAVTSFKLCSFNFKFSFIPFSYLGACFRYCLWILTLRFF